MDDTNTNTNAMPGVAGAMGGSTPMGDTPMQPVAPVADPMASTPSVDPVNVVGTDPTVVPAMDTPVAPVADPMATMESPMGASVAEPTPAVDPMATTVTTSTDTDDTGSVA